MSLSLLSLALSVHMCPRRRRAHRSAGPAEGPCLKSIRGATPIYHVVLHPHTPWYECKPRYPSPPTYLIATMYKLYRGTATNAACPKRVQETSNLLSLVRRQDLGGLLGLHVEHVGVADLEEDRQAERHEDVLREGVLVAEGAEHVAERVEHVAAVLAAGDGWVAEAGIVTDVGAALVRRIDDLVVHHAADGVAQGEDPGEDLERPDDVIAADEEASEDEGREPSLHEIHHTKQRVIELHAEHLREGLPGVHAGREEQDLPPHPLRVEVPNAVGRHAKGENREQEHHGDLQDGVRDDVCGRRDETVSDLATDGLVLGVVGVDGDNTDVSGHTNEPDVDEHLVHDLVLIAMTRLDVDDGEEHVREEEDEAAAKVQHGVAGSKREVAANHDVDLARQRRVVGRLAVLAGVRIEARLAREAGLSPLALLIPRVQDGIHLLLAGEVSVHEVEEEVGRVRVGGDAVADGLEIRERFRSIANVGLAALAEDHDLVEAVKDGSGRLVNGRDEHEVLAGGGFLDEGHDLRGRRGVEAGRRLVQEDDVRALDEREPDGQAALLAAGEALDELVAHARIGAASETHLVDDSIDHLVLLVLGGVEVQVRGVLQRLAAGQEGPVEILLRHHEGAAAKHLVGERGLIERDLAGGLAADSAEGERVDERRLAGAGRAEDGQHVTAFNAAADLAIDDLLHLLAILLAFDHHREGHILELEHRALVLAAAVEALRLPLRRLQFDVACRRGLEIVRLVLSARVHVHAQRASGLGRTLGAVGAG
mmetsp:Transcript_26793/g.83934  ORF Transcript_26793/g.83934 Transcript_26793/m.83934 type:complete len:766 (-) Transcript_26793:220-2517(-)